MGKWWPRRHVQTYWRFINQQQLLTRAYWPPSNLVPPSKLLLSPSTGLGVSWYSQRIDIDTHNETTSRSLSNHPRIWILQGNDLRKVLVTGGHWHDWFILWAYSLLKTFLGWFVFSLDFIFLCFPLGNQTKPKENTRNPRKTIESTQPQTKENQRNTVESTQPQTKEHQRKPKERKPKGNESKSKDTLLWRMHVPVMLLKLSYEMGMVNNSRWLIHSNLVHPDIQS